MSGHSRSGALEHGVKHNPRADYPPNNNVLSVWNDNTITCSSFLRTFLREIIFANVRIFFNLPGIHFMMKNETFWGNIWFGTLHPFLDGQSIFRWMEQKMERIIWCNEELRHHCWFK